MSKKPEPAYSLTTIDDLHPDPENPREITPEAMAGLRESLGSFGDISGLVWNRNTGQLVAGHQRLQALREKYGAALQLDLGTGVGATPVLRAGQDGFPVRVVAWDLNRQHLASLAANNPHIAGEFSKDLQPKLSRLLATEEAAFKALRLDRLQEIDQEKGAGNTAPDDVPELPKKATAKKGDVYHLGRHRILCGDAKDDKAIAALLGDQKAPLLLTDPPYCSGGFQEAGRAAGTFGDIAADNLSSRGYSALIRAVLQACRPQAAYIFTDWRMWTTLFDLVEASGIAARQMIVWDKGTPGLGGLWRTQHELIMFATRGTNQRKNGEDASGNILKADRTGNKLHYTEKPVDLLIQILNNDAKCSRGSCSILDPFLGSGTTLIAAEQTGRTCFGIECEPKFIDVVVSRWESFTGKKAELQHGRN